MPTTSFTYVTTVGFTATGSEELKGFFTKGSIAAAQVPLTHNLTAGTTINKASFETLFSSTGQSTSLIGANLMATITKARCETGILGLINPTLELDKKWSAIDVGTNLNPTWWDTFFTRLSEIDPDINAIAKDDTINFMFTFVPPSGYANTTVGVSYMLTA